MVWNTSLVSQGQWSWLCPLPAACPPAVFQPLVGKIHLCKNCGTWVRSDVFHLGRTRRHLSPCSPGFAMYEIISLFASHRTCVEPYPGFTTAFVCWVLSISPCEVLDNPVLWWLQSSSMAAGPQRTVWWGLHTTELWGMELGGEPDGSQGHNLRLHWTGRGSLVIVLSYQEPWCRMIMRHKCILGTAEPLKW